MNILVIHNYYKIRGGEDAVFENEVNELKIKGHNVTTYTRHNSETDNINVFKKILFFLSSIHNKKNNY